MDQPEREVSWDGAVNLRDLGGLPRAGGARTAAARLYRSARPEYLTERGWRQALAAGLAVVVDLRNPEEIGRRDDDPVVDPQVTAPLQRACCPTEDPGDEQFRRVCGPWLDHPRSYADNLALFPARFALVFRTLAGLEAPALVHCSGGRDRTGLVTAMLLKLAGVATEAIAADYALGVRAVNAFLLAQPERAGAPRPLPAEDLQGWLAPRRDTLADWIDGFDVAGYLRSAGLNAAELERLRTLLT